MPIYKAPIEDVNFLLNDVFQIDRYDNLPGFSDASADVREAILGEAAKLSEQVLQPLNRVGDLEGCTRHDDGSVTTPKGFKEAYKQVAEGGWLGLSAPAEYGGQGLPVTLSQAVNEFQCSANMAFSMYGGLTMGATAALMVHGKPEQKKMFVPKMVAGEWTGTMNLTEPQCGTDLGLLRTKAVKQADGSYKISSSPPASMIWPKTSFIWCWPASRARPPASRACRCSWCRKSWSMPTARWARATASRAARSSTRWASTAIRPA
jgi:acyl-CoA dehydrogenase